MRTTSNALLAPLGAALLSVFAVSGCGGKAAKVTEPPGWGDPASVVSTVTVSQTEIHPGEATEITVEVTNPTNQRILLAFGSGCILMFAVKDATGALVAPKHVVCTAEPLSLELGPHESATAQFTWDGSESHHGAWLPPGDYAVIGGLEPGVARSPSAPVAIRILAP